MSILNNPSRYNNLVVSQGLRIAQGNAASMYVVYKKIACRIEDYLEEKAEQHTDRKTILTYLEVTGHKTLTQLDSIKKLSKLEKLMETSDTNDLIYKVTGRNVDVRIRTILNDSI